eukprot:CAMPEP_0197581262 /NCGR_PEP_ID=MMETSP1326-20131121/4833_1 /TAXON_ID=1155430 /ORGANISM="Genus nov. species nov., Strain RCC2288" /LENGTH=242 /DNA_ID=CAMNT_0043145145 /DNA_START=231 /DNA_END=959 /DNA_ORIENTATION=-
MVALMSTSRTAAAAAFSASLRRSASTSKGLNLHDDGSKQWYTLVRLDEDGAVGHVASDEELRELEELILSEPDDRSSDEEEEESESEAEEEQQRGQQQQQQQREEPEASSEVSEVDSEAEPVTEDTSGGSHHRVLQPHQLPSYQKPGGPCDHCGAQDSPQWRRGPASKPMLCNACGTRYRRTNNLGPCTPQLGSRAAVLVAQTKKRSPPASPSSHLNPAKKMRCDVATRVGGLDRLPPAIRA